MTTHPTFERGGAVSKARDALVPSAVLGALIFVAAEVMFFSGIMSALTISRAGAAPGTWPAPGVPTLASGVGDLTVAVVLASGAALALARRPLRHDRERGRHALLASVLLGATFVLLQVRHATQLLSSGLTLTSSQQASFLFLLGGLHTAHAVATLAALLVAWRRLGSRTLSPGFFAATQVFWAFVVVMWPIVYARVYT